MAAAAPAQAIARRIINILACIAPVDRLPRQTTTTSLPTTSASTQVRAGDLPPLLKSRRSPTALSRIPRPTKGLKLGSAQTSRVTKRWSKAKKRLARCKGLYNHSNSCYMNSVLQCLFNMPEFVGYLDGLHNEPDCSQNEAGICVVCALKTILDAYTDSKVSFIPQKRNGKLENAIKLTIPNNAPLAEYISQDRQGDPYVYLQYLLEQLEACERPDDDPKSANMFKIKARTEWTCKECGNLTVAEDARAASGGGGGVGLSLDIQVPKKGMSMLTYMRHNEFAKKFKVRCESNVCLKKHGKYHEGAERTQTKYISKAPEILIIQLQRYTWERSKMKEIKLRDTVDFEEYVNLGEYTESGTPIIYQLQGVVAHAGRSLRSGHYIAAVREPNGKKFCSINDQVEIGHEWNGSVHELQWPSSGGTDFDPFILFYTKL